MRAIARTVLAGIELRVEGREHVPADGAALLVCRHYHHLYDGAALVAALNRPVRILAGLDWAPDARVRRLMETLCAAAKWPIVLRGGRAAETWGRGYRRDERLAYARDALRRSAGVLRAGDVLAVFPEGAPTVDPRPSGKETEWLPFAPGYLAIAERARREGTPLPLIPTGLHYSGARAKPDAIALRFGPPERIRDARDRAAVGRRIEACVRALSQAW